MASGDWPELSTAVSGPPDLETLVSVTCAL